MKRHVSTLLAAIVAFGIVYAWDIIAKSAKEAEPAENWYVVRNVYVGDFEEGNTKPPVIYDREIRRPFIGDWVVEVHPVGRQENVCPNSSGRSHYDSNDELPAAGVTLEWYLGKPCLIPPGQYVMVTYWTIRAPNYPDKVLTVSSNVFTVFPKGAQLYLTPEQSTVIQQLVPETQQ